MEKEPEIPRTIQNHQKIFSVESMIDFKVSSHDKCWQDGKTQTERIRGLNHIFDYKYFKHHNKVKKETTRRLKHLHEKREADAAAAAAYSMLESRKVVTIKATH